MPTIFIFILNSKSWIFPKAGIFKYKAFFKMTFTNSTGAAVHYSHNLFALLCNHISLLTQGREIFTQTADSLMAKISAQPYQSSTVVANKINLLPALPLQYQYCTIDHRLLILISA